MGNKIHPYYSVCCAVLCRGVLLEKKKSSDQKVVMFFLITYPMCMFPCACVRVCACEMIFAGRIHVVTTRALCIQGTQINKGKII